MNIRFPTDRRATWRQRFVAIARQAEASGAVHAVPGATMKARLPMRRNRGQVTASGKY